jgi:hypothetical protein
LSKSVPSRPDRFSARKRGHKRPTSRSYNFTYLNRPLICYVPLFFYRLCPRHRQDQTQLSLSPRRDDEVTTARVRIRRCCHVPSRGLCTVPSRSCQ